MNSSRISVVIPTHNGAATLAACVESLHASSLLPHEIIVVDDASSDSTADVARRCGCHVLRLDVNVGAARAKNRGAAAATGDILFFTDDDVIVPRDVLARMAEDFHDVRVAGVVGLLDRAIPFDDFASNFKNLWMRFTYARLPRQGIGLFYTSAAAMRRGIFLELGGFDENYHGASIAEDTEFGQRVWAAGHRVLLDDRVAVIHCKQYTLREVLRTDFLRARALTLMRLRKWGQEFYTSVPLFYQLAVPAAFAAMLCLLFTLTHVIFLAAAAIWVVIFYALNAPWLSYLARERGMGFALGAAFFQPVDVSAVGVGMLKAVVEFSRGVRY